MRADVLALAVDELSLIFCHPCTALLALAGVEVGIEDSQEAAVLVEHLVGLDVRVVDGDVLVLLESDAVQSVSQSEDTFDDIGQLKVWAQHLCVQVVLLHLQLVAVEAAVPGMHLTLTFIL